MYYYFRNRSSPFHRAQVSVFAVCLPQALTGISVCDSGGDGRRAPKKQWSYGGCRYRQGTAGGGRTRDGGL